MGAIHTEDDEEQRGCDLGRHPWARYMLLSAAFVFCYGALLLDTDDVPSTTDTALPAEFFLDFWVKLPAVEGLDRASSITAGASPSPTFNMTLRVDNRAVEPWHFRAKPGTGRVVVAYEGVPLAHADLPEFTAPGRIVSSVPIVATSEGLGMPDGLYDRMQIQRRRKERVKLAVHVRLDGVLVWCTVILHGRPQGPFVCPKLYGRGPTFAKRFPYGSSTDESYHL